MNQPLLDPAGASAPAQSRSARPWLAQYDPGVPASLCPYPPRTLLDVLGENVSLRPDHPALWFHGATLSWSELVKLSDAFAAALARLDVRPGDRVALLLPNCPQAVICQLGAWKAGAIVVPLNPLYSQRELAHALGVAGATVAVTLSRVYGALKAIQEQTVVKHVAVTNIKAFLPPLKRLLFTLLREKREGHRTTIQPADHRLADLLRPNAGEGPTADPRPEDPALLMFTGGTTGPPKAAVSSHHALFQSATQIFTWFQDVAEPWTDVNLLLMPLFHTYGNIGTFGVALVGRQKMALVPDPRDLDSLMDTIKRVRPAYLCGVPTLFIALLNHPLASPDRFRCFKLCISGAAPLLAETRQRFAAITGARMLEGYALTESVMAAVLTPLGRDAPPGAVGLPLPDVVLRIVDPTDGETARPAGQVGEICIQAPQLMLGYWEQPEATGTVLRDGWLHTGDLGFLDPEGYLHVVDRLKDLI